MSPIREKFVSIIESLPYNIDEEALKILRAALHMSKCLENRAF